MKKFYVEDMECNHCVNRIKEAMEKESIKGKVDLENRIVSVEEGDGVEELLLDLGFTPKEVE